METSRWSRLRSPLSIFLGMGYVAAGLAHFTHTDFYLPMMPPYLPWHLEFIYLSGAFEILGGIGLILTRTRRLAGWGLMALLIAVFPANIHVALYDVQITSDPVHPIVMWLRLPMQIVFIALVWWAASLGRPPSSVDTPPASHPPSA